MTYSSDFSESQINEYAEYYLWDRIHMIFQWETEKKPIIIPLLETYLYISYL